ncbi:hypothetical protein [Yinghuangia seranimata]|uniref:hypothetical protein n=1 Tax=Yinghuangia seranimata TaxID=408067 RepID=UPI00248AF6E4|nr:hypothetical protein [Yinghuangia seranimata]MDI2131741.1 hypothetical protein [Yinghuangia seranimata]
MANPSYYPPGAMTGHAPQGSPEPPRNARGETPIETERRWLGNITAAVLPIFLAGKLLKPKYRNGRPDPLMERFARIRAWLGLSIVITVFVYAIFKKNKAAKSSGMPAVTPTGASGSIPSLPGANAFATSAPTGLPTGMPTFPTNFPTKFPTGGAGLPTNFTMPAVPGSGAGAATPGTGSGATSGVASTNTEGEIRDAVNQLASAIVHRIVLAPIACAIGIVVIGAVLVMLAHPHARQNTLRQLGHPIRVLLLFITIPAASFGLWYGLHRAAGLRGKAYPLNTDGTQLQLILSWAAAAVALWGVLFSIGALWQITKNLFAAIDGHPLLPALLAMWLAWTLTINDLSLNLGGDIAQISGGEETVPDNLKTAVAVLGSVVITALSLWEISRLYKWNGINHRSGPHGHFHGHQPN